MSPPVVQARPRLSTAINHISSAGWGASVCSASAHSTLQASARDRSIPSSTMASPAVASTASAGTVLTHAAAVTGGSNANQDAQHPGSACLCVEEVQYDTAEFDPAVLRCKAQLTSKLGLAQTARIEALRTHAGGQNQGIWCISDGSQELMLKLVSSRRHHPAVPTETESFLKLAKEYPSLAHDSDLAFPLKLFRCRGPAGQNNHDLIAMRKAHGECFTDVIFRKSQSRRSSELMQDLEALGCFLANIHNRYGLKHGDFQPGNVFYDETSGQITMIDISDLAPLNSSKAREGDVEHFVGALRILATCHGEQLHSEGARRLKAGYAKCRQSRS